MSPKVAPQHALSSEDWDLVIELLKRERTQLPIEIHHTTTRVFREDLKSRLRQVETLLERLEQHA